jgi:CheY-like chemotaxis protein
LLFFLVFCLSPTTFFRGFSLQSLCKFSSLDFAGFADWQEAPALRTVAHMKSTEPATLRILLVDDSPAFLYAATRALAPDPRINIVGKALSGHEAITLVPQIQPDLVLMDVAMPGMNGFEATRQIKAQPNPPRVVVLTSHDLPHYRTAAEAAGADNFVNKADFGSELLPLIDDVLAERVTSAP